MEEVVLSPVKEYVFGAFSLVLLGTLIMFVRAWWNDARHSQKELREVVAQNAVANEKLSSSLDSMTRSFQRLHEELIRRPCIVEPDDPV